MELSWIIFYFLFSAGDNLTMSGVLLNVQVFHGLSVIYELTYCGQMLKILDVDEILGACVIKSNPWFTSFVISSLVIYV